MSAPQPPRQGRLTLRELQERRRKAEAAYQECQQTYDEFLSSARLAKQRPWDELEETHELARRFPQLDVVMARTVAIIKEAQLKDPSMLVEVLDRWAGILWKLRMSHRALPLVLEAVALVKPPKDREQTRLLLMPTLTIGDSLRGLGRFEEAEAAYLELLDLHKSLGNVRMAVYINLGRINMDMGRWEKALEYGLAAEHVMETYEEGDYEQRAETAWILADSYEALGRQEECWVYHRILLRMMDKTRIRHVAVDVSCCPRAAKRAMREGNYQKAEAELKQLVSMYRRNFDRGLFMYAMCIQPVISALRLLVEIQRAGGKEMAAALLEADLDETEAILHGLSQAVLVELQTELQAAAEGSAAAAGAAPAATGATKKKLTRKQQKRKPAQRRKAKARAAAAEAGAGTTTAAGGDGGEEEAKGEAAAIEEQQQPTPEPKPEPDEPEPELEECAICLGDLPARGEAGIALLACSHAFHADCLEQWKAKCLEKGLRFTCAMCRAAVIVVAIVEEGV